MTTSGPSRRATIAVVIFAVGISAVTCPGASASPQVAPSCTTPATQARAGTRCRVPLRASDLGAQAAVPAVGGAGSLGGLGGGIGGPAGISGLTSSAATGAMLNAIGASVSGAASFVVRETEGVLNETTTPQLRSSWFSAAYWKVAAIATILTLPFLFAAAVQALLRSDLTLLLRAALGYLPLALLAVAIAAPVTMLLLSASDELAAVVASASGGHGTDFFTQAVGSLGATGVFAESPFIAFVIGLFTVLGALFLWVELLMREAAVYVVVLMLPLAFAALVWPARRIWAIRAVELLVALILSKFAIVAVLSLGAAALSHSTIGGLGGALAGLVLLVLGAFTPWALLRLIPLSELASSTAGTLRGHTSTALAALQRADVRATQATPWRDTPAQLRHMADAAGGARPRTSGATAEPNGTRPGARADTDVASAGHEDGPDRSAA